MKSNTVYCRDCGQMIIFIKTPKGKNMPCETPGVHYTPHETAKTLIADFDGNLRRGYVIDDPVDGSLYGYIPHWGNCKKPKPAAKPSPPPEAPPPQMSLF